MERSRESTLRIFQVASKTTPLSPKPRACSTVRRPTHPPWKSLTLEEEDYIGARVSRFLPKLLGVSPLILKESTKGQNVGVRLPETTLRVLEEDPNPLSNKLPRQVENVLGGSMFASRTSSTKGQMFGPRRGLIADSSVSKFNFQKLAGTPPHRRLVSRRYLRK
ncbi:hypothetical protein MTR67_006898 [Solanum verrucosum]|uniref:Uncharacterized protein n=1 Tax=Solanum verrucosum TaxID=315347 RepID=A0AAF0PYQ8_SOLVR|nr:hypothetical protein MTR67_006898 [Solanum verrucosum]